MDKFVKDLEFKDINEGHCLDISYLIRVDADSTVVEIIETKATSDNDSLDSVDSMQVEQFTSRFTKILSQKEKDHVIYLIRSNANDFERVKNEIFKYKLFLTT